MNNNNGSQNEHGKRKVIVIDTDFAEHPILFRICAVGANIGYFLALLSIPVAGLLAFLWAGREVYDLTGSMPLSILGSFAGLIVLAGALWFVESRINK